MSMPKEFEEYVKNGIIRKCSINKPRAEFLINETEKAFRGLNKRLEAMGIDEDNANSIVKDCYDTIMELVRAKLLLTGYSSAGQFAHEAEISYLKKCGLSDNVIIFINDLRYFRNSITYYGKVLSVEYAEQVVEFTKKTYPKLKEMVK
ncbi:hypothetical protein COT07_02655 [Candidatus Woesearchaeota archaeon CG07_land_8_20_14_0_80_44_23]|nr:MAG: hypothetical protein COT07_02655 [Candidatus Woesearchaeota archaeon CG07_land_8_20_14_0_80_44_23]